MLNKILGLKKPPGKLLWHQLGLSYSSSGWSWNFSLWGPVFLIAPPLKDPDHLMKGIARPVYGFEWRWCFARLAYIVMFHWGYRGFGIFFNGIGWGRRWK